MSMVGSSSLWVMLLLERQRKCRAVAEFFSRWHSWGLHTGWILNLSELPRNYELHTTSLLNVALEEVLFLFTKIGEEKLVLADQLKNTLR